MIQDPNTQDLTFGSRYVPEMKRYMLGDKTFVAFKSDIFSIDGTTFPKSSGLFELVWMRKPDRRYYTRTDLKNYKKILEYTNAHRKGYQRNAPIIAPNATKYKTLIRELFAPPPPPPQPMEHSGSGLELMTLNKKNIEYVYWDSPNELVDRLRLLIAETNVGNKSHTNEIYSILEELREDGFIY